MYLSRRNFLAATAAGAASLAMKRTTGAIGAEYPPHLRGYEKLYDIDPRAASRQWFREAKFGLFMHYGVYSRLGRGECNSLCL